MKQHGLAAVYNCLAQRCCGRSDREWIRNKSVSTSQRVSALCGFDEGKLGLTVRFNEGSSDGAERANGGVRKD